MAVLALLLATRVPAAEPPPSGTILLPEPAFMHSVPSIPVPDSARTVLVPVRLQGDEVERLTEIEALKFGRGPLEEATAQAAAALLKSIEPVLHRDARGVIEFVELKSPSPVTASVVFAPGLRERFADTLGPDPLVVIPNRFQVFIFPRQATSVQEFAPMIFDAYDATAYPVSPEVFEVTDEGLKAYGVFERP